MTKTKDKVSDAAESIKPYVERAMTDEKLRGDVMSAFGTARELYGELIGETDRPITIATRVATDDDDPRQAARRDRGPAQRERPPPGQEGALRRPEVRRC